MADRFDRSDQDRSPLRDKKSRRAVHDSITDRSGEAQPKGQPQGNNFDLRQPQTERPASVRETIAEHNRTTHPLRESAPAHDAGATSQPEDVRSADASANTDNAQPHSFREAPSREGASVRSEAVDHGRVRRNAPYSSRAAEPGAYTPIQESRGGLQFGDAAVPAADTAHPMDTPIYSDTYAPVEGIVRTPAQDYPGRLHFNDDPHHAPAPIAQPDSFRPARTIDGGAEQTAMPKSNRRQSADAHHKGVTEPTDNGTPVNIQQSEDIRSDNVSTAKPSQDRPDRLHFNNDPEHAPTTQPDFPAGQPATDAVRTVKAKRSAGLVGDTPPTPERPGRLRFDDTTVPAGDSAQPPTAPKPAKRAAVLASNAPQDSAQATLATAPAKQSAGGSATVDSPAPKGSGRLRFKHDATPDTTTPKTKKRDAGRGHNPTGDAKAPDTPKAGPTDSGAPKADSAAGSTAVPPKKSKLHFSADETPPADAPPDRKLTKAHVKADKTAAKLEAAQEKLPTHRRARIKKESDADTGKPRRKLTFEKEVKSQRAHVKGPLPLRPVKAGANAAIVYSHKKMHEVEHENVGAEAFHKGELAAEGAVRRVYHLHKTRPYRRVAKLQKKSVKHSASAAYRQALHDNPKLKSNIISRMAQKRKIKRQYAQAAREAKRAGRTVKKTGDALAAAGKTVVSFVRSHPAVMGTLALILLLMFMIAGFFTSCSNMMSGGLSSILASSYLAEEADIDNAELVYTEWETDLQIQIRNVESDYPSYDEYRYSVDDIGHNPYELMAFLTSVYQNFTYAQVSGVLADLFSEQYTLTFTPETEIRYRTETRTGSTSYTDPETGESYSEDYEYEVEVPYEWHILNITLTARSFTDVIASRMDSDKREIYGLLVQSKGNRQYLSNIFDFNWLPYVSSYYGYRVHPISGEKNYHKGIDIAVAQGTPILAGHDGIVTDVGYDAGGFGNYVVITGESGLVSKYAHCEAVSVTAGQEVKAGDAIATVGSTGNSTGPHLHLEIIKNGQYLNPIFFAETGDDGWSSLPPGTPGGPVIPDYPGEPMGDGSFAALMEIAQAQLGKPYIFGASGPDSFDCSGFVCYALNQSGVASVGRTTAQGLYNMSTPVSRENAMPGDLVYFHSYG